MAGLAVKTIVKKAMQRAGILVRSQEPTANEMNDAVGALNGMLLSWSNDSMLIPARVWQFFTLTGGVGQYTIGAGGNFDTVRPIDIISAFIRQDGTTDLEVIVINDELWQQIQYKAAPGIPQWLNFDNAYPLANIRLNPVPPTSYQLFLLTEKQLGTYAVNDLVDLPPGWDRAIITNLALEIFPEYFDANTSPSEQLVKNAVESKSLIRKAIQKNRNFDAYPQQASPNNIYSGWNNR